SLYNLLHWEANRRHDQRFRDFRSKHLSLTDTTYQTLEQLVATPPVFDAFITGSDQVWRPSLLDRKIGHAFHLAFTSSGQSRRVAYAPSFGVDAVPAPYVERIRQYLMGYDSLSVREKRGQEIVFALTGRSAEHVLDPTLLLAAEDYASVVEPPALGPKGYLLVYPMELGRDMGFFRLVRQIKKQTQLPLVCLLPLDFNFRWLRVADKVIIDAGPREFLGWFKHATFVCTNSFHGTAFSIVFQKNFLGFPHSTSNTRIFDLLEQVGLVHRQISDPVIEKIREALTDPIDYQTVATRLQGCCQRSLAYLQKALQS
ncbi:MAG: polysaccharide pyruvyl transferase family protein, partial [Desulfatitalea sp.]